ncbi:unnamed protein product [Phytophthora fragariaefolia]|uniref:Unnamed protein product n=1 Tax=Phytophthora fragariaefolia TaxID=1490495 RepID=A0A9W6XKV2_9STRA|nr:unnamed protein product [Phytophthora fragariaefolia]
MIPQDGGRSRLTAMAVNTSVRDDAKADLQIGRIVRKPYVTRVDAIDLVGAVLANSDVGAFVLAARVVPCANKLAVTWQGPKRVVRAITDYIYEVQDIVSPFALATHHASRLRYYQDGLQGVTQDLEAHALHAAGGHLVEQFLKVRLGASSRQWEILVEWVGLDPEEASWEPVAVMFQDVPELLKRSGAAQTFRSSSSGGSPRPTDVDESPCPDIGIEVEASWKKVICTPDYCSAVDAYGRCARRGHGIGRT